MGLFNFKKKEIQPKITPAEKYANHLNNIFQREPQFYMNNSKIQGLPGVTSIVYKDIPEPGFITGITYGLSLFNHPSWKKGRPELSISVKSENIEWGAAVGYIANTLRGTCDFKYGDTIDFEYPIHHDSDMSQFLIFAPSIFTEKESYLNVDIGFDYKINICGLYPIYNEEIESLHRLGLKNFWHHPNFDMYDIKRNKIL